MQPASGEPENTQELVPLNVIRVETALSRFPVHRLAKTGTASIEIREKSPDGETLIQWQVSHNSRYGQPGPLAYQIDTLIVNRRIEEASRPIPEVIKLGTQAAIAEELGISTHDTVSTIKRALYQNASTFITANFRYKLANGKTKHFEAGFTRYSVVFTGEELPDGRRAEAVYLVLNPVFMQVLNGAQTRPLDYDYLKGLRPASQRLYELLSFQMFGAIKNTRRDARLSYSEFCTYAPLIRCLKWDQVRPQMARIHRPHIKSGYIHSVTFEQSTDREGKPDWVMVYVPGSRARAEYAAFTKRGGPRVLEIESPAPPSNRAQETGPLEQELIGLGVTPTTAAELVRTFPEERIRTQMEQQAQRKGRNPAGLLVAAIRNGYGALPGFVSKADKAKNEEAKREKGRRDLEEARKKQTAEATRRDQRARVEAYIKGLNPEDLAAFDKEALKYLSPEERSGYEGATNANLERLRLRVIRNSHARRKLKLPQDG
jgi:hypothetical protein